MSAHAGLVADPLAELADALLAGVGLGGHGPKVRDRPSGPNDGAGVRSRRRRRQIESRVSRGPPRGSSAGSSRARARRGAASSEIRCTSPVARRRELRARSRRRPPSSPRRLDQLEHARSRSPVPMLIGAGRRRRRPRPAPRRPRRPHICSRGSGCRRRRRSAGRRRAAGRRRSRSRRPRRAGPGAGRRRCRAAARSPERP